MSRLSLVMLTPATTPHTTNLSQNKRSAKAPAQSLNHLLNFTLPPRQIHYNQSVPRRARKTGNQYGVWNKERKYPRTSPRPWARYLTLCRVCQRSVPVRDESDRRLHRSFRGSGHVSSSSVLSRYLLSIDPRILVIFSGTTSSKS